MFNFFILLVASEYNFNLENYICESKDSKTSTTTTTTSINTTTINNSHNRSNIINSNVKTSVSECTVNFYIPSLI